jgi:hypothetical protein
MRKERVSTRCCALNSCVFLDYAVLAAARQLVCTGIPLQLIDTLLGCCVAAAVCIADMFGPAAAPQLAC